MPRRSIRIRSFVLFGLTVGIMAYAIADELGERSRQDVSNEVEVPPAERDKLHIASVKPVKLAPGGAVIVQVEGVDGADAAALQAEVGKRPAEILQRSGSRLVVRVPSDAPRGQAKLRVLLGERHSKPWVLTLRPLPRLTMVREILGGLALFVLGLRTVGRALQTYAGRRVREVFAVLTRSPARAAAMGVLLGLFAQSTTSAAGLLAGLLSAHMLTTGAALSLLIGAQLGATAAAVLLPFVATEQALWIVTLGVLWVVLANNRLSRSLGMIILGTGVLFHGLELLRAGYGPLVSDPQMLPYLAQLHRSHTGFLLACVSAGAVLTALLQGPAPVFALVMSLAQSSGILELRDGLAVLAGSFLGAVAGTAAASWPFGKDTRKLALAHLWLALPMTALAVLGTPLWAHAARWIAAGDPLDPAFRAGVLFPNMGAHLSVGFAAMTMVVVLAALVCAPRLARSLAPTRTRERSPLPGPVPATTGLGLGLSACERALAALREVTATADRAPVAHAEQALREANETLQGVLQDAAPGSSNDHALHPACVACLHLVSAIDHALRIAEKAPEQGLLPSPETARVLEAMQQRLQVGLAELALGLGEGGTHGQARAQAREIEINAQEAEARRALFTPRALATDTLATRLWASELCAAYEAIGNHLYRIASGLYASADDDLG